MAPGNYSVPSNELDIALGRSSIGPIKDSGAGVTRMNTPTIKLEREDGIGNSDRS